VINFANPVPNFVEFVFNSKEILRRALNSFTGNLIYLNWKDKEKKMKIWLCSPSLLSIKENEKIKLNRDFLLGPFLQSFYPW